MLVVSFPVSDAARWTTEVEKRAAISVTPTDHKGKESVRVMLLWSLKSQNMGGAFQRQHCKKLEVILSYSIFRSYVPTSHILE